MTQWFGGLAVGLAWAACLEAQSVGMTVPVPRGGGVTLDGRVDEREWRLAARVEHPTGTVVRLMRDADHLYLGITSSRPGFASLCLAQGDTVHVLHASAALGAVTYRPAGRVWRSADTAFSYGMRNPALDETARAQRAAFLATHGWVATTVSMSDNQQEFQIALARFPLPMSLALGRWLFTNAGELWPGTIADHEGCVTQTLLRGAVPQDLNFRIPQWIAIPRQ